jgi:hypothetical protein
MKKLDEDTLVTLGIVFILMALMVFGIIIVQVMK